MHDDRYFKSMSHAENALTNFGALKEAVNRTHAVMGMEDAGKSVWRNYPKQPGSNQ